MGTDLTRVGVLGAGYWGPNLIRNFAELSTCQLATVCDKDASRRKRIADRYPQTRVVADYEQMLEDPTLDAVVIATPVEHHYAHARAALQAGKHVLVEKPLATTSKEALDLVQLGEKANRTVMVGHTFLYNDAVHKLKELLQSGSLGDLLYIYSQRVNLGIIRQDINAMWNLAPHDVSIVSHLVGHNPVRASARGFTYLQDGLPDVVFMTVEYPGNIAAHIHVSWLDPQKVRRMTVVGSQKMVVYDDVSVDAKLQIYDKGVDRRAKNGADITAPAFGEYQLHVRSGDLLVPNLDFREPLRGECAHFVDCIRTGKRPLSDGWDGLGVVAVLEAASRSIAQEGAPVAIEKSVFSGAPARTK